MKRNLYIEKRIALVGIIFCFCFPSQAQDPHFSQYFASSMTVNPAFAGEGVDDWRVSANFRSQWWGAFVAPYTTTTIALEKRLASRKTTQNYFAIGGYLLSDASNNGLLKNTYVSLDLAYHVSLDSKGDDQLAVGMSATYANRLIDADKLSFQSQFGSMGFQRTAPSGEAIDILSNRYIDISAGVNYLKKEKNWGYHLGVAVFHAGGPAEGVYKGNQYSLPRRINFSGGLDFDMSNDNVLAIGSMYEKQGSNGIFTLGGLYKIGIHKNETFSSFDLGLWNRFGDALYPYIGTEGKNWQAGFTYDVVTSGVRTGSNSVQSIELSLIWLFGKSEKSSSRNGVGLVY